jgi:flagellin-like protein
MRTACARLRKSEEAVTPVIATILMVAITVVLAAVLWAFLGGLTPPDLPKVVSAIVDQTQNNWTIDVISVQGGPIYTSGVQILVKKADGSAGLNATMLSAMTPGVYYNGVRFVEAAGAGTLGAGDSITLDRAIYTSGSEIRFLSVDGMQTYGKFSV